ncbi:helix-turn-helix domain-containing protein [Kribbella pittospori]|uniref:citrate synthase (unknown stereospecificity) n=1 Tax=Kribbella pittospori TaxID=722689 RepID=A0A4R0KUS4_9ACTN|nr:citrate/2-methylcitrate synthase [Kribbella pittospori]TCC62058.1 helix-turn-helix domain-containing protein [Kribbella pittospori]
MTQQSDENYLTTAEVARRLKVKPETIYAYVSRGLLTSVRARGRRGSLFAIADVERLASRSVEHSGVVERIESALTLLEDDELYYRGHSVRDLAINSSVESVAHLLWTGELTARQPFPAPRESVQLARAAMNVLPGSARLTDKLRVAVAALGAADPLRFDLSPRSVTSVAEKLIGTLIAALPGPSVTSRTTLGARLWPKLSPHPPRPEVLEAAMILLADHGLAVSTVAARVAASARANLYAVVSAGLGALDGQYHGAAPTLAYEFLERAQQDPLAALSDRLRSGEPVPGFGHRIYQERDPRAEVLGELLGDHPITETVSVLAARLPSFPNSDLAVAAMMHAYDFRPDAGDALFALSRIIGWTAHALEEYAAPPLRYRAQGIYTGLPS